MILALALACAHHPDASTPMPDASALDARPEVGPRPDYLPPEATAFSLPNGARVWLLEEHDLPLVSVRLMVAGGSVADPPEHPGLTALADAMLTHGAGERDAEAWAEAAEDLALDIQADTWTRWTVLSLDGHAARLDEGLALLADAVLAPRFDADEVARVLEIRKGELRRRLDDPNTVAVEVSRRLFYGESDPRAHPSGGLSWGLDGLDAEALRASWQARSGADRAVFVVVGDVDRDTLTGLLEARFGDWGAAPEPLPELPPFTPPAPGRYIVDNPDSAQSVLRVSWPGPAAGSPAEAPTRLGIIALGGTFTSRLNRLLREEKGYTYGARARVFPSAHHGLVAASSAVRRDVTGPALADMLGEIARIREGLEEGELQKAQAAAQTRLVGSMDSRAAVASTFAELVDEGLGPDGLRRSKEAMDAATAEAVDAALAAMDLDREVVVVVGDRAAVAEALPADEALPWKLVPREPEAP